MAPLREHVDAACMTRYVVARDFHVHLVVILIPAGAVSRRSHHLLTDNVALPDQSAPPLR